VTQQPFAPMVEVTRGSLVESAHRGAIAVVDDSGHLVASLGSAGQPFFARSCAKPFQALALVCSGAADAFGLTEAELAVVCASHSGEPEHVALVESVLAKAEVSASKLVCGVHPPFDSAARTALSARGAAPSALHNNCSGKHAGMLALSRHLSLPLDGYTDPDHGVQVAIHRLFAYLAGLEPSELRIAVDGCTAPTFSLPLRAFALSLARLAAYGEGLAVARDKSERPIEDDLEDPVDERDDDDATDDATEPADGGLGSAHRALPSEGVALDDEGADFPVPVSRGLQRIWSAMKANPVVVAGSRGRLCTDLMRTAAQVGVPLVAKSGAEGGYAVALVHAGRAYGIALKVEDGAQRARDAAAIETLIQLELLPSAARGPLAGYHHPVVLDRSDEPVGEVRARFRLSHGLPG